MIATDQRLRSGGVWAFTIKSFAVVAALALNIVLARVLPPADLGTYFTVFSIVGVLAVVAQFGLQRAVIRYVASDLAEGRPGAARQIISKVFIHGFVGAAVVAIIIITGGGERIANIVLSTRSISALLPFIAAWVAAQSILSLTAETVRSLADIRSATFIADLLFSILFLIALCTMWFARGASTLQEVILTATSAMVVALVFALVILRRRLPTKEAQESSSQRAFYSFAAPLWAASILAIVWSNGDIWVLSAIRESPDVAVYGAAVRLAGFMVFPLLISNAVVPPLIVEHWVTRDLVSLQTMLRSVASLTSMVSVGLIMTYLFFADQILGLVYGNYYEKSAAVLLILSVGQLGNVLAGSVGFVLMMTGNQVIFMIISAISSILLIVGSILLAPEYGAKGVAFAAASANILQNFLMLLAVRNRLGIWVNADFNLKLAFRLLIKPQGGEAQGL